MCKARQQLNNSSLSILVIFPEYFAGFSTSEVRKHNLISEMMDLPLDGKKDQKMFPEEEIIEFKSFLP